VIARYVCGLNSFLVCLRCSSGVKMNSKVGKEPRLLPFSKDQLFNGNVHSYQDSEDSIVQMKHREDCELSCE